MKLATRLISRALFPTQEWLKGHETVVVRRALEQSQWWSPEQLSDFRVGRLRRLLQRAQRDVVYYRNAFAEVGFDPHAVRAISDLSSLPFLTKDLIRNNLEALRSSTARRLTRLNTGGSSGQPLVFFAGQERITHDVAAKWRATRWWDVDIGDREIVIWGSPIELGTQDRARRIRDALFRTELISAFRMSESDLANVIWRIRRRKPQMLFGYPSSIALVASYAIRKRIRLDDLGTKVVFVTSERLYDHQRSAISQAFGCPVANGYGGRDAGFIAHECPHGGMHITAEDIIVEVVDSNGRPEAPGHPGEIVITHLATRDFPFIRYRTGDVGVLSNRSCHCGRSLPLLEQIQGRTTDFIVAADGTIMHGLALIYVVRELEGVKEFKILQESKTFTRVLVTLMPERQQGTIRDSIIRGFKTRLGNQVDVSVEFVDEIPQSASGKFRYVESRVQQTRAESSDHLDAKYR